MKSVYRLAVAVIAGAGIGGAVIEGLHAQAKGPAYVVVAIRKINDADGFKSGVVEKATPETLKAWVAAMSSGRKISRVSMDLLHSALS